MSDDIITTLPDPSIADRRLRSNLPKGGFSPDPLTDVIRGGARKLIEHPILARGGFSTSGRMASISNRARPRKNNAFW